MLKKSSRKRSSKKKCSKGKIRRKSYTRKNGTRVASRCVNDRGKPGKGPKTLPPLGKDIKLSRFGYSTKKSEKSRRGSLRKASKKHSDLAVLRRLNLARNYQADKKVKAKMSKDVEYMKGRYKRSKK